MKKLFSLLLLNMVLTVMLFAQDKFSKGTIVTVLEIGSSDAYYKERADFIGKDATAISEITKKSNGFFSGSLEFKSGRTIYFTQLKVTKSDAKSDVKSDKKIAGKNTLSGSSITKGTRFEIIEVPSSDAYYSDRNSIEGKTGTLGDDKLIDEEGYVTGTIVTDDGEDYYFYKVKLAKSDTKASKDKVKKTEEISVKYITGTIKKGTSVYVADISKDDSYYSDRQKYIGKKGKIAKSDMAMKDDGYYAGDFEYEDGSTAYFYKAKFSKEPVTSVEAASSDKVSSNNSLSDDDWSWLFGDASLDDDDDWDAAALDITIKPGDKIEITGVSQDDSYYDDRADYIGQKGIAGSDFEYIDYEGGYAGSVKMDKGNGVIPSFYLIKAVKAGATTTPKKTSTTSSSSTTTSSNNSSGALAKGTSVMVIDIDEEDSYFADKAMYVRKKGKVVESMSAIGDGYYTGQIKFDDGKSAYFYKVKLSIVK